MKIKNLKLSPFSIYRIHIRIINTSTLSLVSRHDAIDNRPHPSSVAVVRALKIRGRSKSTRRAIPRFPRFSELCRDTLHGFPHHSMRTASIRCSRRNFNALTDENIVNLSRLSNSRHDFSNSPSRDHVSSTFIFNLRSPREDYTTRRAPLRRRWLIGKRIGRILD